MRFIITLTIIIVFPIFMQAQNVRAYLNYNEFYSPKDGSYIETYTSIKGNSLIWEKTKDNKYMAQVELTMIFKLDSSIISFSKDIIKSPIISDSSGMNQIFMHSHRYILKNGKYDVSIKLDDLNDTLKAFFTTTKIDISKNNDSIFISSIEVFKDYRLSEEKSINYKGGYLITPNIYNYLPEQDSTLNYYVEIYNTKKILGEDQAYLLSYYIKNLENNTVISKYKKFKRIKTSDVKVIMNNIDITDLPSGNFSFVMEVRDRENKKLAESSYFFQRQNTKVVLKEEDIEAINIASTFAELITGQDTLADIIRSMAPISSDMDNSFAELIIKKGDEYVMQQYLYSFWENRNINDPFGSFKKYMKRVREANEVYGSRVNKGYETERGRVFLQYGAPNTIMKEYNDPAAYPFEIWHYYQAQSQNNIKFIFYNTDLSSNEFQLLHSNAVGEPNDYQWRLHLRKRDSGFNSIDDMGNPIDDWGSNINKYYENPR